MVRGRIAVVRAAHSVVELLLVCVCLLPFWCAFCPTRKGVCHNERGDGSGLQAEQLVKTSY